MRAKESALAQPIGAAQPLEITTMDGWLTEWHQQRMGGAAGGMGGGGGMATDAEITTMTRLLGSL